MVIRVFVFSEHYRCIIQDCGNLLCTSVHISEERIKEDEGFELRHFVTYGVFETFVFIKHRFCFIYPNISNCSFYTNPLKGNLKGKNMGKQNCK